MTKGNKIAIFTGIAVPIALFVMIIGLSSVCNILLIRSSAGPPHTVIAITDVSLCEKQGERYQVIETPAILPSDIMTISICGSVDVNESYRTAGMHWKYGNEIIFDDTIRLDKDVSDFVSTMKSDDGFQPGIYEVTMFIGSAELWQLTFQVEG